MTHPPTGRWPKLPLVVALLLVALAGGRAVAPCSRRPSGATALLVLLPETDVRAARTRWAALAAHLGADGRHRSAPGGGADREAFEAGTARGAGDGVRTAWLLLAAVGGLAAAGDGAPPGALEPAAHLGAGQPARPRTAGLQPWRTSPSRTVFGDSLSLVCLAPLCAEGGPWCEAAVGVGRLG